GPDLVDLGWSRRDLHPAVLDAVNGGAGAGDGVDVIERLWTNDLVRGVGRLLAGRCRSARYGEGWHGDHDADSDRRRRDAAPTSGGSHAELHWASLGMRR